MLCVCVCVFFLNQYRAKFRDSFVLDLGSNCMYLRIPTTAIETGYIALKKKPQKNSTFKELLFLLLLRFEDIIVKNSTYDKPIVNINSV